jgi:hypothetical protein
MKQLIDNPPSEVPFFLTMAALLILLVIGAQLLRKLATGKNKKWWPLIFALIAFMFFGMRFAYQNLSDDYNSWTSEINEKVSNEVSEKYNLKIEEPVATVEWIKKYRSSTPKTNVNLDGLKATRSDGTEVRVYLEFTNDGNGIIAKILGPEDEAPSVSNH